MTIRTKLIITFLSLSAGILLAAGVLSTFILDGYFERRLSGELQAHTREIEVILRSGLRNDEQPYASLRNLADTLRMRLTLISENGAVLFDSEVPESDLPSIDNHLDRPEIVQARQDGVGTSSRISKTIHQDMMYVARRIPARGESASPFAGTRFVRLGMDLTEIRSMRDDIATSMLLTSSIVLFVVGILSVVIAHRISSPLREMEQVASRIRSGDLQLRLPVRSRDEIGLLCDTLNRMIDALNEDIVKLKKLERFRSEFLGNVSHELRTPLFALQASIETLIDGAVHDPAVNFDFLDKALKNARRLDDLLSDLIEISRIESGEMKMSYRYFNASDFIRQAVSEVESQARNKSITIDVPETSSVANVFGDRDRIKQVLMNLLTNAIKYTEDGGRITVRLDALPAGARFSVTDTGCGIAPAHIPRIFERFYRVDPGRSRDVGGTGLGLAIVKHIIEAHGSHVEVQSETGKGSTFSFVLKT